MATFRNIAIQTVLGVFFLIVMGTLGKTNGLPSWADPFSPAVNSDMSVAGCTAGVVMPLVSDSTGSPAAIKCGSWPSQAAVSVGAPATRSLVFATAYQASDPTKAAKVSVEITCTATVALGSAAANTVELRLGPDNSVASGGGTRADIYRSDLSVSIVISLGWTGQAMLKADLPAGYYFSPRRTSGTGCTITSAFDQSVI